MRSWSAVLLVTALAAAAGAETATAAEIRVGRSCYADPLDREDVVSLSGSGFVPDAADHVTLDGEPLPGGDGRTNDSGRLSGTFAAPSIRTISRIAKQHRFRLGVRQAGAAASTTFTVSRLFASFKPATGNLASLRVRFKLYGFSLQGARRPPVYVHYVSPSGRLKRTSRLGIASQACGFLQTRRRRLFAFGARRGAWRLQFDTRRTYTRGTSRSSFLFYTLRVDVA